MKLTMRLVNEDAQDLPAYDNEIETTEMGACVSVIVAWDKQLGRYRQMRGFHGSGGIENVNAVSLCAGVPDHQDTQVFVISGSDNLTQYARAKLNEWYRVNIRNRIPRAHVRFHHEVNNAKVNRDGDVTILGVRGH